VGAPPQTPRLQGGAENGASIVVLPSLRALRQGEEILRRSAWATRATTARVGGFPLLTVLVYVADEYPAVHAGVGTLQASVVRLYGVVVILNGWVRVGCARLCAVHEAPPRGPGSGVVQHLRGHSFIQRPHYTRYVP
jgi:hypothetical protein